jgi:hypothetical protein
MENKLLVDKIGSAVIAKMLELYQNANISVAGKTVFSKSDLGENIQMKIEVNEFSYDVSLKRVKSIDLRVNESALIHWLNSLLNNEMLKLRYSKLGTKNAFFRSEDRKNLPRCYYYPGFRINFSLYNESIFLRV